MGNVFNKLVEPVTLQGINRRISVQRGELKIQHKMFKKVVENMLPDICK